MERLAANQAVLDLGLAAPAGSEPLPITSSQMTHLWDGLCAAYRILGFESATNGDNVFRDLVLARIIEPTSKSDAERVLREVGVEPASYATVKRHLPSYAQPRWRQALASASARRAGLGPASLILFDVSTLYFETDAGDGFREPGFSKERRLEPQITLGLLTDAGGFPLTVEAFEGNKAETATMLPVINAFKAAHQLRDVTIVADAGMISEANQVALQAAGLSYILGARARPRRKSPLPSRSHWPGAAQRSPYAAPCSPRPSARSHPVWPRNRPPNGGSRSATSPVYRSPNMPATAVIAAHCDGYCGRTSATMRTARSRSSSGYLLARPITRILPRSGVSGNPGTAQGERSAPERLN